ncbi:MAG: 4-hydroxythreonine-4-phosphate dehydrogenase PdxA [Candidatus Omnitrophica bacterium]|jgi:4-hydroxythreonine-4-phosphate dehydrogenase|nr:4-hydroxythreonine-4-phosphate dehydrogenase PdxA [Candidatus Omnitrophota bacterium]
MIKKPRIAITMGDPSGIGPEIIAKSLNKIKGLADFTIIGDAFVLEKSGCDFRKNKVRLVDLNNVSPGDFCFGKTRASYGRACVDYLDVCVRMAANNQVDCIVTSPVSKEALSMAGFNIVGHSEYFKKAFGVKNIVMMLLNKSLRFALLTRHIPLKDVSGSINASGLKQTFCLTVESLNKMFSIKTPRLVICALNPHASDNGTIGDEENKIIKPFLAAIGKNKGYSVKLLPADVAIKKMDQKLFDCALALYHDQALIPLKLSGDDTGVNITLGLPLVRTSALHGVGFDIAGKNLARPDSFITAVKQAVSCFKNSKYARNR